MQKKCLTIDTVPMDQEGYEAKGVLRVLNAMQLNGDGNQCRNIVETTTQFNPFAFTGSFRENAGSGQWEYIYHDKP